MVNGHWWKMAWPLAIGGRWHGSLMEGGMVHRSKMARLIGGRWRGHWPVVEDDVANGI